MWLVICSRSRGFVSGEAEFPGTFIRGVVAGEYNLHAVTEDNGSAGRRIKGELRKQRLAAHRHNSSVDDRRAARAPPGVVDPRVTQRDSP